MPVVLQCLERISQPKMDECFLGLQGLESCLSPLEAMDSAEVARLESAAAVSVARRPAGDSAGQVRRSAN